MKRIPKIILVSAICALVFGFLTVYLSKYVHHNENGFPWNEVLRDVGISFIVAGFISVVYEWSTRSSEKRSHMKHVLDETLSVFIPNALWQEVQSEVFLRKVFRTNMEMNIIIHELNYTDAVTNQSIEIPNHLLVLYCKMSYELKGISSGSSKIDIKHHLDQHMFNSSLMLPKFIKAKVIDTDKAQTDYSGQTLEKVVKEGVLSLTNENAVKVSYEDSPSLIEIERYELVSNPGLYTIVLPEMVIPDTTSQKSITLTIDSTNITSKSLKIAVQTWFNSPKHHFKEVETGKKWEFYGVMLPGQGFSIEIS